MEEFYRIRRLPPYVFEQVNRAKAAARNAGADIIDLGMGNPDLPTPAHVIEKLKETLGKPRTDRYSASRGITGLRKAQAAYYDRRFGVKLNPDTQIVATLGSKEGFANVAQAITAPGDVVLCPNPSYPIHAFGFLMAGGVIRSVPSEPTPQFFEAVERAIVHSIPKPLAIVVCYPPIRPPMSRPSTSTGISWRSRKSMRSSSCRIWLTPKFISTTATRRPRCCRFPAPIDVTVEFTSMSKTFSMAGWRMGFAVGNERIIAALARVKSYLDYGAFTPIQVAATAALNGPDGLHSRDAGHLPQAPRCVGGIVRPGGLGNSAASSLNVRVGSFAGGVPRRRQHAVRNPDGRKSGVVVSPGVAFGEHGEGYVRIAMVENEQRIRQAARGVRRFLESGIETLHNVVPLATRR